MRPFLSRTMLLLSAFGLVAGCGSSDGPAPADPLEIPQGLDAAPDAQDGAAQDVPDPDVPGLGVDWRDVEPGGLPRYELDGEDWTAIPWPNDLARNEQGLPDLTRLPDPGNSMWEDYLAYASEVMEGFGLNGSIYFQFDRPIDMESLPDELDSMVNPKAIVQLVNVTAGSTRYGEQLPLTFDFYEDGNDAYYLPNTLSLRPVVGFPLAEGETYCAIVTRGVLDEDGLYLDVAPDFGATLDTEAVLAPLMAWLEGSKLLRDDLAVAACFTTDEATRGLREIRQFLEVQELPVITELTYEGKANVFYEFRGYYDAPNFQTGEKPYEYEGGDFVYGEDGYPVVQLVESVYFLLMVPSAHAMPETGWPVVLYGHGTGGDHQSCKSAVADPILKEGLAMICIDLPLHGARGDPSWDTNLLSFNFLNPRAGRTNFRQAAIDTMSLAQMVVGGLFDIPAGTVVYDEDIVIDPDNIHYFGHSHGGLSGAINLGIEPLLRSAVLSGAGGVLTETILRRTDLMNFAVLFASLMNVQDDELDGFHPSLTVVQMMVDATDPINYAPYWLHPGPGGTPKHVFVTEGTEDEATHYVTTNAMAAAAGLPLIEPVAIESLAHHLRGLPTFAVPAAKTVTNETGHQLTGAIRQWEGGDHWVAFDHPQARANWTAFFRAIKYGQTPVISN